MFRARRSRASLAAVFCAVAASVLVATLSWGPLNRALGLDQPVCGDANGDGQIDISDAIRLLAFQFSGGPPPVCSIPPAPPCEPCVPRDPIADWITQKGTPAIAVTPNEVFALRGLELDRYYSSAIYPDPFLSSAVIILDDGTETLVPLILFDDPADLLSIALEAKQESGKLRIKNINSQCTKVIVCDATCRPLLPPHGKTHLKEEPLNAKERITCEPAASGECEMWLDDVCLKTYYEDDRCQRPTKTFKRRELVCQ